MKIENLLSLSLPNPNPSGDPIVVKGPPGVDTTSDILLNLPQFLITVIFVVGTILAIVFILLSGIQWILSGGDEKRIEGARKRLTYSIIGLIVILSSVYIISLVFSLLGVDAKFFGIDNLKQAPAERVIPTDCIEQFGYEACSGAAENPVVPEKNCTLHFEQFGICI